MDPTRALAEGTLDGRPTAVAARLAAYPPGGMAGITGTPLAIAARLVDFGTIDTVGVHAPDTSVPPSALFDELVSSCVGATDTDKLVQYVVTESVHSWDKDLGRPWRVTEVEVCCQQSQPGESLGVPDRPPIVPAQRHDSGRTGTSRQPLIPICKQGVVGLIPIVSTLRFLVKFPRRNFP